MHFISLSARILWWADITIVLAFHLIQGTDFYVYIILPFPPHHALDFEGGVTQIDRVETEDARPLYLWDRVVQLSSVWIGMSL